MTSIVTLLTRHLDITIAVALVVAALLVCLLSRLKMLPKGSLPVIFAAIAGALGVTLFNRYRARKLAEELLKREAELKAKEAALEPLKQAADARARDLEIALKRIADEKSAYERRIAELNAKTAEEKAAIDAKSNEEVAADVRAWLKEL